LENNGMSFPFIVQAVKDILGQKKLLKRS